MTLLITWVTRRERWTGSGSIGRMVAAERRGIRSLLLLHAVHGTALLAAGDAGGIQRATHDLVAHAREILDAAAAHEHDGVLLQVVALAGDVGRDLDRAGDPHASDLAQRRVRLLRRGRIDAGADAATLRSSHLLLVPLAGLQPGRGHLARLGLATLADELARGGHAARDGSKRSGAVPSRARTAVHGAAPARASSRAAAATSGAWHPCPPPWVRFREGSPPP